MLVAKLDFTLLSFQRTTARDATRTFLRPQDPRPPSSLGGPEGQRADYADPLERCQANPSKLFVKPISRSLRTSWGAAVAAAPDPATAPADRRIRGKQAPWGAARAPVGALGRAPPPT